MLPHDYGGLRVSVEEIDLFTSNLPPYIVLVVLTRQDRYFPKVIMSDEHVITLTPYFIVDAGGVGRIILTLNYTLSTTSSMR